MNRGNVASFGCGHEHPNLSDVGCVRSRFHAGDHRGFDGARLIEWPDAPAPVAALPEAELIAPRPIRSTPYRLDEAGESVTWGPGKVDPGNVVLWLLALVIMTGWPVVLVALIRWVG